MKHLISAAVLTLALLPQANACPFDDQAEEDLSIVCSVQAPDAKAAAKPAAKYPSSAETEVGVCDGMGSLSAEDVDTMAAVRGDFLK